MKAMGAIRPGMVAGLPKALSALASKEAMTELYTQAGLQVLDVNKHHRYALTRELINPRDYVSRTHSIAEVCWQLCHIHD